MKKSNILLALAGVLAPLFALATSPEFTVKIENSFPEIEGLVGASSYYSLKNDVPTGYDGFIPGCHLTKRGDSYLIMDHPPWSPSVAVDVKKAIYSFNKFDQAVYTEAFPTSAPTPDVCGANHSQKDWTHQLRIEKGKHFVVAIETNITCIDNASGNETTYETLTVCDFKFQLRK